MQNLRKCETVNKTISVVRMLTQSWPWHSCATLLRNEFVVGRVLSFCLARILFLAFRLALSFCLQNEGCFSLTCVCVCCVTHAHACVFARRMTFLRTNRFGPQKRIASFKNILEVRRSVRNFRLMVHRCVPPRILLSVRRVNNGLTLFPRAAWSTWNNKSYKS